LNIKNIINHKNNFISIREKLLEIKEISKNETQDPLVIFFLFTTLFLPVITTIGLLELNLLNSIELIIPYSIAGSCLMGFLLNKLFNKIYKKREDSNFLKIFSKYNPEIIISKKQSNQINEIVINLSKEEELIQESPEDIFSLSNENVSTQLIAYLEYSNNDNKEKEDAIEIIKSLGIKKDIEKLQLMKNINNNSLIKNTMIKKI
jgi:hypothetical protein